VLSARARGARPRRDPRGGGRSIKRHFGIAADDAADRDETLVQPPQAAAEETAAEVVRHEEQLSVGTQARATERVRVRKRVVTEDVTLTVTIAGRSSSSTGRRSPMDPPQRRRVPLLRGWRESSSPALRGARRHEAHRAVERVRLHRDVSDEERHVTETCAQGTVDVET
jgi:hypothetical protein